MKDDGCIPPRGNRDAVRRSYFASLLPASYTRQDRRRPLFCSALRSGESTIAVVGLASRPAARAPRRKCVMDAPTCRPSSTAQDNPAPCSSAADPWVGPSIGTDPQEKLIVDRAPNASPRHWSKLGPNLTAYQLIDYLRKSGAQGRNRTTDTVIFSHVLYQLSYLGAGPVGRRGVIEARRRCVQQTPG